MSLHAPLAPRKQKPIITINEGHLPRPSAIASRNAASYLKEREHAQLHGAAAMAGIRVSEQQVREILEQFVRYGLVHRVRSAPGETRYEHSHVGRHHDHVVCVRCGHIQTVRIPVAGALDRIGTETGFRALHSHIEIHGLCPKCQQGEPTTFPLAEAGSGDQLRVASIQGGREMSRRLHEMGLAVGVPLIALTGGRGPATVRVGETRMAIGHGMAQKVWVERIEPTDRLDNVPTTGPTA